MVTIIYPLNNEVGGISTYTRRILKGLRSKGFIFEELPIKKAEIKILGRSFGGIILQNLKKATRRKIKDLTHALYPRVADKNTDIVTIHDLMPFQYKNIYIKNFIDKYTWFSAYKYAKNWKLLLASTNYGKEKIKEFLGVEDEKIKVLYHSIEHDIFYRVKENPYPDDNKIHVLTVSDFNPRKKLDILYQAISQEKDFTLYHIGPVNGWTERYNILKNMATKTDNIKILGPVSIEKLREYYSNADIFVYLSIDEGFGYPPLEAMACGTNVVVSDIPVFREVYKDQAFYTKDENVMDTIKLALKNKKDPVALKNFTLNYSIDKEINEIINIYNSFE